MKYCSLFARLLCALEGNYLEADSESMEHVDSLEHVQYFKFSCSIPAVTGRGFIEVCYSSPPLANIYCFTYVSSHILVILDKFSFMIVALLIYVCALS